MKIKNFDLFYFNDNCKSFFCDVSRAESRIVLIENGQMIHIFKQWKNDLSFLVIF